MATSSVWSKKGMIALLIILTFLTSTLPLFFYTQSSTPLVVRFPTSETGNWVIDPKIKQMAKSMDEEWIPVMVRFKEYINESLVEELDNLSYLRVRRDAHGNPLLVNLGDIHVLPCDIRGYDKLEEFTKRYQNRIMYVENNFRQYMSPIIVNETEEILQTISSQGVDGKVYQPKGAKQPAEPKWWVALTKAPQVWSLQLNGNDITGRGVSIVFLDAGIDDWQFETPEGNFTKTQGEVILNIEGSTGIVIDTSNTPYDPIPDIHPYGVNHGTACAGAAAGGDNRGVAKGANIIDIRVIDWDFGYDPANLIFWMAWCAANRDKYNISVINFSDGTDNPIRMSRTTATAE